jgi:cytoskeletal protein CcmA (bactofilin family)
VGIFNKTNPTQVYSSQTHQGEAVTIIAPGNRFTGDIEVSGQLQVDGTMEGNISAQDTMTVGAQGLVTGLIKGQVVQIAGGFEGEIWCQDLVIFSGGEVSGKVHCQQMVVEVGGNFIGHRDELTMESKNDSVRQESNDGKLGILLEPMDAN